MGDTRYDLYRDLHGRQLAAEQQNNRRSADLIIDILWEYLQPASVLDVGCGIGTWLSAMQSRGVQEVQGIDGPWLKTADLLCDPAYVQVVDLEAGFDLGRSFDLVISLEVGEHLSPAAAKRFVASLARHSSAILFSAAIPFQGGHHHVNEQFLSYWVRLFADHGFQALDIIRGRVWDDVNVLWWLRQNIVLFARDEFIAAHEGLQREVSNNRRPISIVHPDVYMSRIQGVVNQLAEFQRLDAYLRKGGVFRVKVDANGQLQIRKLSQT